jgi:hypothetical protein
MATNGVKGVVAESVGELGAAIEAARLEPDQVELFAQLPSRFAGDERAAQELRARRGRGRPPGAQNRMTSDMRDFLRARGFDPMLWKVGWAQHTPESLAKELNCTTAEAFDRLDKLYGELLGYFYGKVAPVSENGEAVPFLVLQGYAGAGLAPDAPPWLQDPRRRQIEQKQGLSDQDSEKSQGAESHGAENASKSNDMGS